MIAKAQAIRANAAEAKQRRRLARQRIPPLKTFRDAQAALAWVAAEATVGGHGGLTPEAAREITTAIMQWIRVQDYASQINALKQRLRDLGVTP